MTNPGDRFFSRCLNDQISVVLFGEFSQQSEPHETVLVYLQGSLRLRDTNQELADDGENDVHETCDNDTPTA